MDHALIEFCSPTLASLKVGSLFNYAYTSTEQLYQELERLNVALRGKGVCLLLLRRKGGRALIYLYRPGQLAQLLECPRIRRFLREQGYSSFGVSEVLEQLRERLGEDFPHEIGIFLGYPLEDVVGFIRCQGCGYKCAGLWKVYGDEDQARRQFAVFERCRQAYRKLWQAGKSVQQLTVSA